jgi:hypothetical protein
MPKIDFDALGRDIEQQTDRTIRKYGAEEARKAFEVVIDKLQNAVAECCFYLGAPSEFAKNVSRGTFVPLVIQGGKE